MLDRDTFESWHSKKQRSYAERMYSVVRKEVLEDFRDAGQWRDKTGGVREVTHHCWEKGMGGAIPLWYYFQKDNLIPWSDGMHKTFHDVSRDKWTDAQKWEAELAEVMKQDMIEDNKIYYAVQISQSFDSVADVIKKIT